MAGQLLPGRADRVIHPARATMARRLDDDRPRQNLAGMAERGKC